MGRPHKTTKGQKQQPSLLHFWGKPSQPQDRTKSSKQNESNEKKEKKKKRSVDDDVSPTRTCVDSQMEGDPTMVQSTTVSPSPNDAKHIGPMLMESKTVRSVSPTADDKDQNTNRKGLDESPSNTLTVATSEGPISTPTKRDKLGSLVTNHQDGSERDSSMCSNGDSSESPLSSQPLFNACAVDGHQLSDYELLRLRNIERNNARLVALGLFKPEPLQVKQPKKSQRKRKKVTADTTRRVATRAIPTRRSTRRRQPVLSSTNHQTEAMISTEELPHRQQPIEEGPEEPEEQFEVSPVVQYAMEEAPSRRASHLEPDREITSLSPLEHRLSPPKGLSAIYSLRFNKSWLAGAGKAGIIALWDINDASSSDKQSTSTDDYSTTDPILSWKAHGGRWIADVRFLSEMRLATAGNDGSVHLWDLATTSLTTGAPKCLYKTGKEIHTSGIFAMDVSGNACCTGSKDKTVAVTPLDAIGQAPLWRSDYHSSKVSAVQWREKEDDCSTNHSSILASASDDGLVCIHDCRTFGKPVAILDNAHEKPHSVVWNPVDKHVFLTAGLDDVIQTWDTRHVKKPICSYYGHVPNSKRRRKRIHHPVFYFPNNKAAFILTGGEDSHSISLFRQSEREKESSTVFSRGTLPDDCGDAGTIAVHQELVAASVGGGEILLMECL